MSLLPIDLQRLFSHRCIVYLYAQSSCLASCILFTASRQIMRNFARSFRRSPMTPIEIVFLSDWYETDFLFTSVQTLPLRQFCRDSSLFIYESQMYHLSVAFQNLPSCHYAMHFVSWLSGYPYASFSWTGIPKCFYCLEVR